MNTYRQNDQGSLHDSHLWSNRIACMLHMICAQIFHHQIILPNSIVQDQWKILKESLFYPFEMFSADRY